MLVFASQRGRGWFGESLFFKKIRANWNLLRQRPARCYLIPRGYEEMLRQLREVLSQITGSPVAFDPSSVGDELAM
nr:hypothetical protein [Rubripirellula sp.]